jgi:hypothetical protein
MSQNATGFLAALGKDDEEDDVPRRKRKRTDPAPAELPPADTPASAADPIPEQAPPPAAVAVPAPAADVPIPGTPVVAVPRRKRPEPVHKTSVDLRLTLKDALAILVDRDRRGPKAELNEALEAHLRAKGIHIEDWKG